MWYGDLVTPYWWDDLWLKEAFATWMSFAVVHDWRPEWNVWLEFEHERAEAMELVDGFVVPLRQALEQRLEHFKPLLDVRQVKRETQALCALQPVMAAFALHQPHQRGRVDVRFSGEVHEAAFLGGIDFFDAQRRRPLAQRGDSHEILRRLR